MRINQSIFRRGKTGGDVGPIQNASTLRLTHFDEHENKTSRTWQYATKQDVSNTYPKKAIVHQDRWIQLCARDVHEPAKTQ